MKDEVAQILNHSKNGKGARPDRFPAEILTLIEEDQLQILVDLFNTIYKTRITPNEKLISICVTVPNKAFLKAFTTEYITNSKRILA